MKKRIVKAVAAPLMVVAITLAAPGLLPVQENVAEAEAASVKISTKSLVLIKGKSKTLKISGTKEKVTWSSSKKSVAVVNRKGQVTAKRKGTARITAKVGKKKYTCKITVEDPKLNKSSLSLKTKKKYRLALSGTTKPIRWTSKNKSVATVSSKGLVRGVGAGTTTITATVGGKRFACKVKVTKPAGKAPSCTARQTVYLQASATDPRLPVSINTSIRPSNLIYIKNLAKDAKVTDIKISNSHFRADYEKGLGAIQIITLGTNEEVLNVNALLTFTVKQNGETYKLSCRVITEKQKESPFARLTIGSRDMASDFGVTNGVYAQGLSGDQPVNITMSPGYILDKIEVSYWVAGVGSQTQELQNGDTMHFDNFSGLQISYHTTKKPANYRKPMEWDDRLYPSPLHDMAFMLKAKVY